MNQVHIVGRGAIGLLLANKLAQHTQVTLITRDDDFDDYHLIDNEKSHAIPVSQTTFDSLRSKITHCIVPVKAYQLSQALHALAPHLHDDANIILSHNGMSDVSEIIQSLKTNQALYFLTTSMGGMKPLANTVKYTGAGLTQIGACNQIAQARLPSLFQGLIQPCLSQAQPVDDINEIRWQKLCVNIAINPLSALLQCKNGKLRAPAYARQVLSLLNEACFVAGLDGVELKLSSELMRAYQVMKLTAENNSSMAQDIKIGRRTEIDAICGFIVSRANRHGVSVPENEWMWQQIKRKERA
ncbi:ketopantoate reductase family protein [Pseudoalteromonas luteoviolacea]|uniref:2-dehydropantoate 2-reductase n=1 Tax=Pseudoalteromonas luteoviolacea NCIMB 1942 TaxID=1365253 RepID=A0A162A314_9GAMM|nr:ketopantoate reductase family protein [Pseudoalteromonas luteoviolacea]KZN45768.1 hypothetical protein N482_13745 [Pseudoalteromonas luteoviolacea NCIMB 1942]